MEVPREQLMELIELAERCLELEVSEFSANPTIKERNLMSSIYRLVDDNSEVEPDGSSTRTVDEVA